MRRAFIISALGSTLVMSSISRVSPVSAVEADADTSAGSNCGSSPDNDSDRDPGGSPPGWASAGADSDVDGGWASASAYVWLNGSEKYDDTSESWGVSDPLCNPYASASASTSGTELFIKNMLQEDDMDVTLVVFIPGSDSFFDGQGEVVDPGPDPEFTRQGFTFREVPNGSLPESMAPRSGRLLFGRSAPQFSASVRCDSRCERFS